MGDEEAVVARRGDGQIDRIGVLLELDGSLDERYLEWRRLLVELAAAEQGLPPESKTLPATSCRAGS